MNRFERLIIRMNYYLIDQNEWQQLLPLTYTKSIADLRVGILTIREKWEKMLNAKVGIITEDYLQTKYSIENSSSDVLLINSSVLPNEELIKRIHELKKDESLFSHSKFIAAHTTSISKKIEHKLKSEYLSPFLQLNFPWDIFRINAEAIEADFDLITKGRNSAHLSASNTVLSHNKDRIFLEEGAKIEATVLNASNGSIYIGKNAEIMEGCLIRGGFSLGESAQLKMGTKIYGATTVGPGCRVGGEVNNSVLMENSNKAHDGFLGNSVVGEWCNLGADTNNSNLKNNYGEVKVFSEQKGELINTGLQFCGLIMGDHSKSGINTMFNTGTIVGVNANIFGGDFPTKHVPSFSWGGKNGFVTFDLEKSFEVSERVLSRRNKTFSENDKSIMRHIFQITEKYRSKK